MLEQIEAMYIQKCNSLSGIKEKKVLEFSNQIKTDINDLFKGKDVSKNVVQEYFQTLYETLEQKENEIDAQIKLEQNKALNELKESINSLLEQYDEEITTVTLTDDVMTTSLDYFEEILKEKMPVQKNQENPFLSRLDNVMPNSEYTTQELEVSDNATVADIFDSLDDIISLPRHTAKVVNNDTVATADDEAVFSESFINTQLAANEEVIIKEEVKPEPANVVEEQISTVDLEKLLAEVQDLI